MSKEQYEQAMLLLDEMEECYKKIAALNASFGNGFTGV